MGKYGCNVENKNQSKSPIFHCLSFGKTIQWYKRHCEKAVYDT